jgi:hypothetical protein
MEVAFMVKSVLKFKMINSLTIISLVVSASLSGCFSKDEGLLFSCDFPVKSKSISPDKKFIAYVRIGSCGATTPTMTKISLSEIDHSLDRDKKKLITSMREESKVSLNWMSKNKLIVSTNYTENELSNPKKNGGI